MTNFKTLNARNDFPVVGIGASAGGLEACQHMFEAMPEKTGMAFLLIQHLLPDHSSLMVDLLAGRTKMRVAQATEGMRLEPDHLYLIPPGMVMSVAGGAVHLEPAVVGPALRLPFDHLLRSMAADLGARAVAVVLTGTGSDGSAALGAIRDAGGAVFVQDPDEAAFEGMPRAALATGMATRTETLAGLARALIAHATAWRMPPGAADVSDALKGIVALLRDTMHHDFSLYKTGTLQRRIEQRIALLPLQRGDLGGYLALLQTDKDEAERLAQNLFINVTGFFRDAEVFALLESQIIPGIVQAHAGKLPIRIWVIGCSTGQEAYSLAMLFFEAITAAKADCQVQIFATDADTNALAEARDGYYSDVQGVTKARLARHFEADGAGYRVKTALRAAVTFAQHDVLSDPPFAGLDFVSCRNVMIYLAPQAQGQLLESFHLALVPGGLLLLGSAETADAQGARFRSVSETGRLYRNQARLGLRANDGAQRPAHPAPADPALGPVAGPEVELEEGRLDLPAREVPYQGDLADALRELDLALAAKQALRKDARQASQEYQAANEELLASKEELQSLNEELTALNGQLQETLSTQRATADDLQNVLYSTNVATLFLDADLQIRFFTPAVLALFSLRPGDIGRPLADLAPLSSDRELLADARAVLTGEPSVEQEIEAQAGKWFNRRVFPYLTRSGKIAGVVITFTDYTDRRKITESLAAAERTAQLASDAKTRFLAVASHDLRQPLQTMVILQGLLAAAATNQRSADLTIRLGETLAAMARMLDVLLDMNQIAAGVIRPEKTLFPIDEIFERLRAEFSYSARANGLELHILHSSLEVNSDPSLLEQILRNLLSNALKYTHKGKVLIGCRRRGKGVDIEVWDTGIGIAESEIEAIFEEYHQVNNPARERSLGLGLGLSIVKRLGVLLSHQIGTVSRPGHGSVFTVSIDEATAQPSRAKPLAPKVRPTQSLVLSGKVRIMVVEDDPDVRDLLDMVLRDRGHETMLAEDGPQALALISGGAAPPDLLLTDYNLPGGLNGLALAAALRKALNTDIPTIVLTGDISTLSMQRISQEDVQHLAKPVTVDRLNRAVAELLGAAAEEPAAPALPVEVAPAEAEAFHAADPAALCTADGLVFLVDDDDALRQALGESLREHGYRVQDYPTAEAFLAGYVPGTLGCLLIDAALPGISGLELLRQLKLRADPLAAIMITGYGDIAIAVEAMKAGASDFVEKPVSMPDLLERIGVLLASSHETDRHSEERRSNRASLATLTTRQRQVMEAVMAGKPSKIIAFDLGISQRTIESHRAAIMEKLGVSSVPALVRAVLGAN